MKETSIFGDIVLFVMVKTWISITI